MRTVDLREETVGVDDLLRRAGADSLLIIAGDGQRYTLEEADDFDEEVAMLSRSEKFMAFLEERSKEDGRFSLEDLERELEKT